MRGFIFLGLVVLPVTKPSRQSMRRAFFLSVLGIRWWMACDGGFQHRGLPKDAYSRPQSEVQLS